MICVFYVDLLNSYSNSIITQSVISSVREKLTKACLVGSLLLHTLLLAGFSDDILGCITGTSRHGLFDDLFLKRKGNHVYSMLQRIQTARLQFIPYSLELKKATLTNKTHMEQLLGAYVPPHWPLPDYVEALPFFIRLMENDPLGTIWDGIIVHKADQQVIGDIGFKGGPDEHGMIEIGYSILPEYRGAGYATEMARGLINWVFQNLSIARITAECLDDNIGSVKVLEKIGMQRLPADGRMLKWKVEKTSFREA